MPDDPLQGVRPGSLADALAAQPRRVQRVLPAPTAPRSAGWWEAQIIMINTRRLYGLDASV